MNQINNRKMTPELMTEIKRQLDTGVRHESIGRTTGVSSAAVSKVKLALEGQKRDYIPPYFYKMARKLTKNTDEPRILDTHCPKKAKSGGLEAALTNLNEIATQMIGSIEKIDRRLVEIDDLLIDIENRTNSVRENL